MTTQTALITGASRGLGLALAHALAEQGWTLILDARTSADLNAARASLPPQARVIAAAGDVTDAAHRAELAGIAQAVGGVDVLVNNASTLGTSPMPDLLSFPLDLLATIYTTNVIAPLGLLQAIFPQLKPGARVINVTSDAGKEAYAGWGGYGSSKAALEHLSAIFAAEHPELRVYWVDPGDMRTQMHQDAFPGEDISDRPLPEVSVPGFLKLIEGSLPSGRYQAQSMTAKEAPRARWLNLVLRVDDVDHTAALYRDGLGMPVIEEWTQTGHGYLLDAGRATLEIVDAVQAADVDRIEAGSPQGQRVRLALEVGDVNAAREQLAAYGAQALAGVVDTPWGHRNQRVQAHDGLQMTLFEVFEPQAQFQAPADTRPNTPLDSEPR
ncbi:MAG: SDR family NAD(P)-dependent oxidoreductase [Anaerolineae bacterium]